MRRRIVAAIALGMVMLAQAVASPAASADFAPPTNVPGDHTGDFRADLIGTTKDGQLILWKSNAKTQRVEATGPWDAHHNWSSVTAIVQYRVNFMGYTDVLVRRSNGGLYDHHGYGAYVDGDFRSLLDSYGQQVGRNWNAIDAIIPIDRGLDGTQLIARNRIDMKLYLYDWEYDSEFNLVLRGRGPIGSGWGGMRQIFSLGNFCGDSNPDLISVHNSGILYCYPLDASGRSGEGVRIGHGWNNFQTAFSSGDLNGDGHRDLVGIRSDGAAFGYPNQGGRWGEHYWLAHIDLSLLNAIG